MISVGALISVFGTLNVIMLACSRLPFAMATHGQLPAALARIHPRFRTPHVSILVSALAILVFALPGTFIYAVKFTVITRLIVFGSTCVALPVLRWRTKTAASSTLKDERLPFKVPAGPFVAVVCVLLCLWLLANSGWVEIRDISIAVAVGVVVYAATRLGQRKLQA